MLRILFFGNPPQTRSVTTFRFALGFLSWLVFVACFLAPAKAAGPLSVGASNPRFFVDSNGKAVYLTGVHLNNDLVDRSDKAVLDFTGYLNFLQQYEHNFVRLWAWEQAAWTNESTAKITFDPLPYQRKGPGTALDGGRKFDLSRFNQAYFDRLRSRVVEAGQHGIYVSVMLFQGFSSQRKAIGGGNPWTGHPFNVSNNINGINGDPSGNDNGEEVHSLIVPAITTIQEAYVRKVVDTLNDLDNVLYEISGDAPSSSRDWQYYMINYLKRYQVTKSKQHPVGMSYLYLGSADDLLASPADWILLPGTDIDPPLAAGSKVIFSDMDPKLLASGTSYPLVWKSFMRGFNPIYLESGLTNPSGDENVRDSMGYTLKYSQLVDLSSMSPNSESCSSGYCLINPGREYLVYLPTGGTVRVDLSAASGSFVVSWFSPLTGRTTSGGTVSAGIPILFTSPIDGDAVLYLQAMPALSSQSSDTSTSLASADTTLTAATTSTQKSSLSLSTVGPVSLIPVSLIQGSSITTTINATLTSIKKWPIDFSVSGLPQGVSGVFSPNSCTPNCSTQLTLTASTSAVVGSYTITVKGKNKQYQATTSFALSVAQPAVSTPAITPNGGTFAGSVSVSLQTSTSGASIYYTTDGTTPTQSSNQYMAPFALAATALVKAQAFKSGMTPSSQVSAWFTQDVSFDFSLSNSGNKSVIAGSPVTNTISAALTSGSAQAVTFSASGLPVGATASFSSSSCNLTCSSTLTINTSGSTPAGTSAITVSVAGGGVTRTTSFNLMVSLPTVATPTISPNGGSFSGSVSVTLQTATAGASIYYTTDGTAPTQSSIPYTSAMTLTSSATVKAAAFKSGSNPSAVASANFTITQPFNFSLTNSGDKSVTAGSPVTNTISATLTSGSTQAVTFSASGLPGGATASFSSSSCNPTCSSTLTINTSGSTPAGTSAITVSATGGGVTRTTSFNLTVNLPTVATPTISPNGGSFANSVSVSLQTSTSGASIYYTTDGTTPTQSSNQYMAPFALTATALVKAQAFKSGITPSSQVSAWFTKDTSSNSISTNIADGAVLSGSSVVWTATSSDSPVRVEFFIDGALLWTENASPYQFNGDPSGTLNTIMLSNGSHQLKVRATYSDNTTAERTVTITVSNGTPPTFDFSLANGGNKSVTQGQAVTNTITTTLISGTSQGVAFSGSGLPAGTTASFSPASCSPTCSSTLTINTSGSTPAGSSTITVTAIGGGVTKTTTFSLTVSSPTITPTVSTPTMTPNGGSFTGSVSVTLQTATSGASIYYTIDGSTPTQSSLSYTGPITLTSSATVKAFAFEAGFNPSAVAGATFTVAPAPSQVTLTWQDNSTNESNFGVERKTGTSGTYVQIALVSANTTSYVDTSVTHGVTYCYRVDATNSAGVSAYTNEVCAIAP